MRPWFSSATLVLLLAASSPQPAPAQVTSFPDEFDGSGGVTVDVDGNIYVADFGTTLAGAGRDLWRIQPDGSRSLYATGLNGGSGNDFDSAGNLYQANINDGVIHKITPGGVLSVFSTGHRAPVGVVVDDDDNVFVANCGNGRIRKVTPDGTSTVFVVNGNLVCPNGMTRDESGNLYVSNYNNGSVVKVTPSGVVSVVAQVPGQNNGYITYSHGNLYVCARFANQIYKVSLAGEVTLLAGTGEPGADDGPLLEATFSWPTGIHASADGRYLYVNGRVDPTGNLNPVRLRVLDLEGGTVRTHPSSFGQVKARF